MNRARRSDESYDEYRRSLKYENKWLKQRIAAGRMLWPEERGTYVRKREGDL